MIKMKEGRLGNVQIHQTTDYQYQSILIDTNHKINKNQGGIYLTDKST